MKFYGQPADKPADSSSSGGAGTSVEKVHSPTAAVEVA